MFWLSFPSLGKYPYGQQRPLSTGWTLTTTTSHFGLCGIFALQVWAMRFTWRRELLGESSPDKWISHNNQEGTTQLERNKQSQIFLYLESRVKLSSHSRNVVCDERKPYLGCCLRISECVEQRRQGGWNCCGRCPFYKALPHENKPCHGDKT